MALKIVMSSNIELLIHCFLNIIISGGALFLPNGGIGTRIDIKKKAQTVVT
jgi:hypothetical protein